MKYSMFDDSSAGMGGGLLLCTIKRQPLSEQVLNFVCGFGLCARHGLDRNDEEQIDDELRRLHVDTCNGRT